MFITANQANATLSAGITAAAVSLTVTTGQGARFPAVAAPDRIACVLSEAGTFEYVDITAHAAASDTFTIVRAIDAYQSGTPTALAFTTAAKLIAVQTKRFVENTEPLFLPSQAANPVVSARDGVQVYARNYGGRRMPKYMGPTGIDNYFQQSLWDSNHIVWAPGSAAAFSFLGGGPTVTGTITTVPPAAGSYGAEVNSRNIASAATLNTSVGLLGATAQFARIVATGHGGFWIFFRFINGANTAASYRLFAGLCSLAALPVTDPSAMAASFIGVGFDAADTTLQIMRKDGTTVQKVSVVGSNKTAGSMYDVGIWCPQGNGTIAGNIFYRVDDVNAGTTLQQDSTTGVSTNAPLANTMMRPMFCVGTAAAAAQSTKLVRAYFYSDY